MANKNSERECEMDGANCIAPRGRIVELDGARGVIQSDELRRSFTFWRHSGMVPGQGKRPRVDDEVLLVLYQPDSGDPDDLGKLRGWTFAHDRQKAS